MATTVVQVGGVSASDIAAGATAANSATDANTPSTIIRRDASGNIAVGEITASGITVSGNAVLTTASAVDASKITSGTLLLGSDPTAALGAATKQYIDAAVSTRQSALGYTPVNQAGDTMTGALTLVTGTATVAPLKLSSGTNLTTPEAGAVEFDGSNLYFTNSTPARQKFAMYPEASTPANGQLLIGNGTGFSVAHLTAGSGVSITNSAGGISISSTGSGGTVTSIATGAGLTGGPITGAGTISLAAPSSTTLGGVKSLAAAANQFLTAIGTDGSVTQAQPSFSNLSGSVADSQMPALTGDVTTTAGTVATTIANNAVTYGKFQQVGASSLVGNPTGSAANASEISLGSTLGFNGSTLQTTAMTGDVTSSTNSFATTLSSTGVSAGTYKSVTVDTKGRVLAGSNPTTLAGYGITDAATSASPAFTGNVLMPGSGIWNSSGNVGIGTTSPGAILDVQGVTYLGKLVTTGNNIALGPDANGYHPYDADILIGSNIGTRHDSSIMMWSATDAARIAVSSNDIYFSGFANGPTSGNTKIGGYIGNSSYFLGNVGIGTTSPANKLSVSGNANFTGNVGIGTTSPGAALDVNGAIRPGSSTVVTTTCDGTAEGMLRYNYTSHFTEYCDGTIWRAMSAVAGQTVPNAFSFTDQTGVNTSATITSNAVTLSGFTGSLTASCTNCTAIARNGVWGGTSVVGFQANDTITIRLTSSASLGTATTATVTVGGTTSGTWSVTTTGSTPNAFSFTDKTDVATQWSVSSDAVTLTGFTGTLTASCTGCTGIAKNGVWGGTTMTGFASGNTIAIRLLPSALTGTATTATVTVGNTTSSTWTVTTTSACQSGIAIGGTCPDGTIYAGLSPDTSVPMYTTPCDANQYWDGSSCVACATGVWTGSGTSCVTSYTDTVTSAAGSYGGGPGITWNNGSGNWTTTGYTNGTTGKANTGGLVALSDVGGPYGAANYCAQLSANTHSDWYLPASSELNILYLNKIAIGNFNVSGSLYWSSTEYSNIYAWYQRFSDGSQNLNSKNYAYLVRCVRR